MDFNTPLEMDQALYDFRAARRKAILTEIIGALQGNPPQLIPFDQVRQKLKTPVTGRQVLKDIPLDAIVGSVNRYDDFTRGFLPRSTIDPKRWANVLAAQHSLSGLPPIEVYQIDQVYFVLDGNHRVSVARQMGMKFIHALVTEIPSRIKLTPDITPDDLIIKAEYLDFLEATRLDINHPEAEIEMTAPGQYPKLLCLIAEHQHKLSQKKHREVSFEEAASHWYETDYLPLAKIILTRGLLRDFPGRTQADLYIWLVEKRDLIEKELGIQVELQSTAGQLAKRFSPSLRRIPNRLLRKLKDHLVPDALEAGPPPGEWRKEVLNYRGHEVLFSDILVPISGSQESWLALEQAKLIAHKETARVHGLHILPRSPKKELPNPEELKKEFEERCRKDEIPGELTLTKGEPARRISEFAAWVDLVVINLNYPPYPQLLSKSRSGFRSLVLRCPRPILVVPRRVSPLNRALLAYDDSPKAQEALYIAAYLAGKWCIPLVVLTIQEENTDLSAQQKAREYLESQNIQAVYEQMRGPVAASILVMAEEYHCDWIIMGGYGSAPLVNFLLDNVVDQILRSSARPMLLCR